MARSSASAFLPETVGEVLHQACRTAGLDSSGAVMLRLGENLLYQLTSVPAVVRIGRDMKHWDDATKEVAVANWLATQGFPAAQTYDLDVSQPLEVEGHPVTFWYFLPGRAADISEAGILGGLLRRLHQLPRPPELSLPVWQPFNHVAKRLDQAPIPAADAEFLRDRVRELETEVEQLEFALPATALHGDAHVKNVMVTDDGRAVLIDLEAFAFGPAEWDLAKTAAEASMGMLAEQDYAAFAGGYGYDVTAWSGWPVLQGVMQVKMISWLAQNVDHSAGVRAEYDKRIRTLRSGVLVEPWSGQ